MNILVPANNKSITTPTWSTISTTESDDERYFKLSYRNIAPINIILCALIIVLNGLVVYRYYKNRTKITFLLFFLISISDIMTAIGNFFFAGGVILWSRDPENYDKMMWWFIVVYRVAGLLGYSCSILLNTLLAVLRSIKIYNPFYRPSMLAVVIIGVMYALLLIAFTVFDLYTMSLNSYFSNFLNLWYFISPFEEMYPFPGQTIPWTLFIGYGFNSTLSTIIQFTILSVIYMIPVVLVIISVMVQIYIGVQHSRSRPSDTAIPLNDWAHVNTTVFLLASVFLMCNSALTFAAMMVFIISKNMDINYVNFRSIAKLMMEIQGPVTTVLPLFNAVLTPVIIVLRNRGLLADIVGRIRSLCTFRTLSEE